MTLKLQLTLLLVLVTFTPIAFMTYQMQQQAAEEFIASKDNSLILANNNLSNLFDGYIQNTLEVLWADSHIPSFRRFLEGDDDYRSEYLNNVHEMLRNVIIKDSIFVNSAALLNIDGMNLIDTSATLYHDIESYYPYYREGVKTYHGYFSKHLVQDVQGYALYASVPIKNGQGEAIGLLRLRIDPSRVQLMLSKALKKTTFQAKVFDSKHNVLANLNNPHLIGSAQSVAELEPVPAPTWVLNEENQKVRVIRTSLSSIPWMIEITLPSADYTAYIDQSFFQWLIDIGIIFLITLAGSIGLATYLVIPILKVEDAAKQIASGRTDQDVPLVGGLELRRMAESIKRMKDTILASVVEMEQKNKDKEKAELALLELNEQLERRVEERTQELLAANKEKGEAMEQLVNSQKMAELGTLVAGVTHEVNTPLGNNVTVASTLQEHLEQFKSLVETGCVKKSDLSEFLNSCEFATDILQKNCARASELMGSFKQVAVDQTSMRRRNFSVEKSVHEVITTLHNVLKKHNHSIRVHIPQTLHIDNYPGPFDQVITNLINNSVIHGFRNMKQGEITITARIKDVGDKSFVVIDFEDNGAGVPEKIVDRIFEPFFTTRAEDVGSGMGLYLIKSIVEKDLKGRIYLDKEYREGARFVLEVPMVFDDDVDE
ncbi:ATP-binding protein [Litoribrevibacter euphylliae]|uniref:histidine kinase n=1 Tax=Litoribrevibacter euphylliae TaxID=1834034 RepID=A0ABV7HEV1_9GAMM